MRLNTQVSEYDCATTSLLNSLKILYKKDEIPITIIRIILRNTLDCKNKIIGDCGTSKKRMKKICKKINNYSKQINFNLNMKYFNKDMCNINLIKNCINNNGVVIVRSILELEHYYLITGIDDNDIYIWDPYIESQIYNTYNIKLPIKNIDNEEENNYSLGPIHNREIILVIKDC